MKTDALKFRSSLRATLLYHLLLILLPTLLLGTGLAYFVAVQRVGDVFDMNLLDVARDLASETDVREGKLILELPQATQDMLRTANHDRISYAVWNSQQGLISGDGDLQVDAPGPTTKSAQPYYFASVQFRNRHQRVVHFSTTAHGQPLRIAVAQTTSARNGIQRSIFASVFFLGTLLTAVALGGVYLGIRRGLQPIAALSAAINTRSPANLSALPAAQTPHELRPIIDNINSLFERLGQSLLAHRHFIADAAHQLRTPLAALNAQLEVALKIPPADVPAMLVQMLTTTQRASHLANQLLSLARLEHAEQIPQTTEVIALDDILRAVLPRTVLAAEAAGIELEFDIKPCRVFGNRILLEELFSNLFDNEVRYVQRGGQVTMRGQPMRGATHGNRVEISLIDSGPGVAAEDIEKLGTAFFRGSSLGSSFDSSRDNANGCGLGLAIAREIVRLHQGTLHFSRASSAGGLRIDIELPAA